ncbi:MAG: family oxidoreductase [Acidimicrobiaceae bacterium]|nr:family oxidoreductase [Acidimicrobiaceae bacterium]
MIDVERISLHAQGAVVVGAGGGIGAAAARLLAGRGASVFCVDRDGAAAQQTAASIEARSGTALSAQGDVADQRSLASAFEHAVDRFGQVHIVINCVGVQGPLGRRSHEVGLDEFDAVYAINLRGAFLVGQMALPHMLERQYGRIAHVASIAGKEGNPNMIGYSTTKAGLIGMVKAQGKEYAEDGITINALAPAVIRTAFLDTQPAEVVKYMTDRIPMKRPGSVEEVAEMLAWMVSPGCSFTTGFTFDLSGGRATY